MNNISLGPVSNRRGRNSTKAKDAKRVKTAILDAKLGKLGLYHTVYLIHLLDYSYVKRRYKLVSIQFLFDFFFLPLFTEPVENFSLTGCCRYDSSLGEPPHMYMFI